MVKLDRANLSWVAGCVAALLCGWPMAALACSEDPPRPDLIAWWPNGLGVTALVAPSGTVVSLGLDGSAWVSWSLAGRHESLPARLSRDGSTLFTIHAWRNPDPASYHCGVDGAEIRATSLRTGVSRSVGAIGTAPSYVGDLQVSPHGHRVAASAIGLAEGDSAYEVFDAREARRLRVVSALSFRWVDDDHYLIDDGAGHRSVVRASDGVELHSLTAAEPTEPLGYARSSSDSGTSFFLLADNAFALTLSGSAGLTVSPVPWAGLPDDDHSRTLMSVDGQGRLAAWRRIGSPPSLPMIEVIEASSGLPRARVSGQAVYAAASLSPNGELLAVISHGPIRLDGLGDTRSDSPATLEVIELGTGRTVRWSPIARSHSSQVELLGQPGP